MDGGRAARGRRARRRSLGRMWVPACRRGPVVAVCRRGGGSADRRTPARRRRGPPRDALAGRGARRRTRRGHRDPSAAAPRRRRARCSGAPCRRRRRRDRGRSRQQPPRIGVGRVASDRRADRVCGVGLGLGAMATAHGSVATVVAADLSGGARDLVSARRLAPWRRRAWLPHARCSPCRSDPPARPPRGLPSGACRPSPRSSR